MVHLSASSTLSTTAYCAGTLERVRGSARKAAGMGEGVGEVEGVTPSVKEEEGVGVPVGVGVGVGVGVAVGVAEAQALGVPRAVAAGEKEREGEMVSVGRLAELGRALLVSVSVPVAAPLPCAVPEAVRLALGDRDGVAVGVCVRVPPPIPRLAEGRGDGVYEGLAEALGEWVLLLLAPTLRVPVEECVEECVDRGEGVEEALPPPPPPPPPARAGEPVGAADVVPEAQRLRWGVREALYVARALAVADAPVGERERVGCSDTEGEAVAAEEALLLLESLREREGEGVREGLWDALGVAAPPPLRPPGLPVALGEPATGVAVRAAGVKEGGGDAVGAEGEGVAAPAGVGDGRGVAVLA